MELSKYIEAITNALSKKLSSGIATVDAFMSPEGHLHGGTVAVDGKPFRVRDLPCGDEAQSVRVRFSISLA